MMITAQKVMAELATGLSAVCAWCEHWHNAKDRGVEAMCGQLQCGGPSVGKGFPSYKGIMENRLNSFCFICNNDAEAGVEIDGRMIGVCNTMGPNGETCMDKLKKILARQKIIARENVVPVIGGDKKELGD